MVLRAGFLFPLSILFNNWIQSLPLGGTDDLSVISLYSYTELHQPRSIFGGCESKNSIKDLTCFERVNQWKWLRQDITTHYRGTKLATRKMSLWHADYFELESNQGSEEALGLGTLAKTLLPIQKAWVWFLTRELETTCRNEDPVQPNEYMYKDPGRKFPSFNCLEEFWYSIPAIVSITRDTCSEYR